MKTDSQLQKDIQDQLEWEASIENAGQIGVTTKNGIVTLTGYVANYTEKMAAERVAKLIVGVKAIANDLEVRLLKFNERSDTDIATAAVYALKWHAAITDEHIKVTVRNGQITLEGKVDWNYQREAACDAVRSLIGAKGLINLLTIVPKVQPGEVAGKIESAFKRSAEVDARRVHVEAHDGTVVLSGKVTSWSERDEAERAAWSAPGVTKVENHVTVGA